MEENKNSTTDNMPSDNEVTPKTQKPFKKKKFNGHLRNNNKKERVIVHDEVTENTPIVKPIYSDLFYLLRQKYSSNTNLFFEQLENILKEVSFKDIKEGKMTLFSYAALYEKTDILNQLSKNYKHEIILEDFQDNLIPSSLNKGEDTLNTSLNIFNQYLSDNNLKFEHQFMKDLFKTMAKISYRAQNNTMLLNWLEPHQNQDTCKVFWNEVLNAKNISLVNIALDNSKALKSYLKDNFLEFETILDSMGRKFEITNKLNIQHNDPALTKKIEPEISDTPKIYLSNAQEQMQNFTKEEVNTKVTIRRKKAAA